MLFSIPSRQFGYIWKQISVEGFAGGTHNFALEVQCLYPVLKEMDPANPI